MSTTRLHKPRSVKLTLQPQLELLQPSSTPRLQPSSTLRFHNRLQLEPPLPPLNRLQLELPPLLLLTLRELTEVNTTTDHPREPTLMETETSRLLTELTTLPQELQPTTPSQSPPTIRLPEPLLEEAKFPNHRELLLEEVRSLEAELFRVKPTTLPHREPTPPRTTSSSTTN